MGLGGWGGASYELVAGERRWRAAQLAGLTTIPAIITDVSDEESAEWALIENLQRDDLGPMEKARALRSLAETFALTHTQIADKVGLDRSSVTNMIRLTELEAEIIALLDQRRLTLGHGKALLAFPPGPQRIEIARRAVEEEWSVRRLEREASKPLPAATPTGSSPQQTGTNSTNALDRDTGIRDLEEQLTKFLGTKVELSVAKGGERGRIVVSFFGLDHFDSLMAKIGFQAH